MNNFLHNIDWAVALRNDLFTIVFKGFTVLGYGSFLVILVAVGYWSWNKKIFARAGLWLILSALFNGYLKDLFQDPRPDAVYQLDSAIGTSFGFPSGHAQIAVVMWFWIALEVRKKWTWIICSLIVSGICFSRLYLGVHDLEDILGGAVIGLVSLIIFKFLTGDHFKWWEKVHPLLQILAIGAVELTFFIFWPQKKIPDKFIAYAFFLIALWSGVLYERRKIHMVYKQDLWRRITAVVMGLMMLVLIQWAFDKIILFAENWYLALKIIEAILTGLFITVLSPLLFHSLYLADADTGI